MTWERNLRALQRCHPELAEALSQVQAQDGIEVHTAKNGDPVPVWRDRPLYSRYNPRREAEAWAANISGDTEHRNRVYLVFGFGLGYHLEALLKQAPNTRFVVFETNLEWWRRLLELRDVRHIVKHKRVHVLPTVDFAPGTPAFNTAMHGIFAGEIKVVEVPVYRELFAAAHDQWVKGVTDALRYLRVGLATQERWKTQWLANSIANLVATFSNPGVIDLKNHLADTPAVMVAAGPSLNDHIEALRGLVGRVPIIAAGTGLVPLAQADIHPDYVVSIDPGEGNYEALKDCLNLPNTTLVFTSSLYPRIVNEFRGPKVAAFADQEQLPRWIGEQTGWNKGVLPDAASVAIPTLQFILGLGCREIVLLGQDLSFLDPEKYYAGRRQLKKMPDHFPRPNVSGGTAYTTRQMLAMLRELEMYVAGANRTGRTVYNVSHTGLPIKGTKPVDFITWIKQHNHRTYKNPERRAAHPSQDEVLKKLREPIADLRRDLLDLHNLASAVKHNLETDEPTEDQLNSAISKLNQAINITTYQKVIRRTMQNLDTLVQARKLNFATASKAQIKDHSTLLFNFAACMAENSRRYYDDLEQIPTKFGG